MGGGHYYGRGPISGVRPVPEGSDPATPSAWSDVTLDLHCGSWGGGGGEGLGEAWYCNLLHSLLHRSWQASMGV